MNTKELIASELASIIDSLDQEAILHLLETPKNSDMGDIAFPAFSLAKVERKAPQMIAADIAEKINSQAFEKVVATGPYVNFFLDKAAISGQVLQDVITEKEHYADQEIGQQENVVIDMSSPNIAKPFSIGHLRSTVIGDSLSHIFQKIGYKTVKVNHLGDWGKQFGMLIVAYKKWGNEEAVKAHPIDELLKLYVRINAEAENDPSLDEEAREWFRKLENGDEEALALWQWFRDESLVEFNRLYNELQVEFDSYNGEAFYNDKMDEVVTLLEDKQLLKESRGAEIIDLEKYDLNPAMIRKSDGSTLYLTRDLAAALFRKRMYHHAQSLYVVGAEQSNHFAQLKAVLSEMGFTWSDQIHHIPFGLMSLNGKKMSTRKGNIIQLEDVLNDSIKLARQQIEEKNPTLANADQVAEEVGVGAVIFHDLKNERTNSVDFKLEEVVKFEGETGPYVQYAHARAESILRKAGRPSFEGATLTVDGQEAWEVAKKIGQYQETIVRAANEYDPSLIGKYALSLAKSFNQYYAHTRILEEDDQKLSRLALVQAVSDVLKSALALLGVKAPDEM